MLFYSTETNRTFVNNRALAYERCRQQSIINKSRASKIIEVSDLQTCKKKPFEVMRILSNDRLEIYNLNPNRNRVATSGMVRLGPGEFSE